MENEPEIFITFFLAMIGYAGLTITLLFSLKSKIPVFFWRLITIIIFVHVIMVWTYSYDWQFAHSVRNGYSGFIIFHSALLVILISNMVKDSTTKILIIISYIVVTTGAVGAVFRYSVVEIYRIPVLFFMLTGAGGLLFHYLKKN
ncbi:MAG: hypothetical protein EHM47_14410 [Ignavibacteriales bacterium]|nr:MAG: hypothetical protein EHM47_14410 [Ignavibacteriales bacterium]